VDDGVVGLLFSKTQAAKIACGRFAKFLKFGESLSGSFSDTTLPMPKSKTISLQK
jgi:hypothetical protein